MIRLYIAAALLVAIAGALGYAQWERAGRIEAEGRAATLRVSLDRAQAAIADRDEQTRRMAALASARGQDARQLRTATAELRLRNRDLMQKFRDEENAAEIPTPEGEANAPVVRCHCNFTRDDIDRVRRESPIGRPAAPRSDPAAGAGQ